MNKKLPKFFYHSLLVLFLVFGLWLLAQLPVSAQASLPLTVAPARQEIQADPGEKASIIVKFYNRGDQPISGILKVADFIVEDKEGSPTFLEGPNQFAPRFAAASWVEIPDEKVTIAAKDKVIVQARISVPKDASAGGRYFAIYFEPGGTPASAKAIAGKEATTPVTIRLAGLVYLRVSGPIEENARLVQLTAPQFLEYGPIAVKSEILNLGNYHIQPKGAITLTSMFGKRIAQSALIERNIFPETSRSFENQLASRWLIGKYKIELTASYGETGKILTGTVYTWVLPWKVMTAIILAVLIIILTTYLLYGRFKKREEKLEEQVEELEEKLKEKK